MEDPAVGDGLDFWGDSLASPTWGAPDMRVGTKPWAHRDASQLRRVHTTEHGLATAIPLCHLSHKAGEQLWIREGRPHADRGGRPLSWLLKTSHMRHMAVSGFGSGGHTQDESP